MPRKPPEPPAKIVQLKKANKKQIRPEKHDLSLSSQIESWLLLLPEANKGHAFRNLAIKQLVDFYHHIEELNDDHLLGYQFDILKALFETDNRGKAGKWAAERLMQITAAADNLGTKIRFYGYIFGSDPAKLIKKKILAQAGSLFSEFDGSEFINFLKNPNEFYHPGSAYFLAELLFQEARYLKDQSFIVAYINLLLGRKDLLPEEIQRKLSAFLMYLVCTTEEIKTHMLDTDLQDLLKDVVNIADPVPAPRTFDELLEENPDTPVIKLKPKKHVKLKE